MPLPIRRPAYVARVLRSAARRAGRRGNTLCEGEAAREWGLDPRLREQLARLVEALRFAGSPLPAQPVGLGACWEQPLYGTEGSGTARFELEALEGERATLGLLILADDEVKRWERAMGLQGQINPERIIPRHYINNWRDRFLEGKATFGRADW